MSCGKLYYFVHLDAAGHPIPSTMFGKSNAASNTCTTKIAPLTGKPMTPPAGYQQCIGKSHKRWWYQIDRNGNILPNSMIMVEGVPTHTGTGTCHYIEYQIFKPIVS